MKTLRILGSLIATGAAAAAVAIGCSSEVVHTADLSFQIDNGRAFGYDCQEPTGKYLYYANAAKNFADLSAAVQAGDFAKAKEVLKRDAGTLSTETNPPEMAARLAPQCGGRGKACIVVDALRVKDGAGCISSQLADACGPNGCPIVPSFRATREVTLDAAEMAADPARAVTSALQSLQGQPIWNGVPDGSVFVRVVVTGEPCSAITETHQFDCDHLVGCAVSCPTALENFNGKVLLSLNVGVLDSSPNDAGENPAQGLRTETCQLAIVGCASTPLGVSMSCPYPIPRPACSK